MSSIEERLVRDIAAVTGGVVVTESDLRVAREAIAERTGVRHQDHRRTLLATAAAVVLVVALGVAAFLTLGGKDEAAPPAGPAPTPSTDPNADFLSGSAPTSDLLQGVWRLDDGEVLMRFAPPDLVSFDRAGRLFEAPGVQGRYAIDKDLITVTVEGGNGGCDGQQFALRGSLPEQGSLHLVHTGSTVSGTCQWVEDERWAMEQLLPTSPGMAGVGFSTDRGWSPLPSKSRLYGTWLAEGGGYLLEIAESGTYNVASGTGQQVDRGDWALRGSRLTLTSGGDSVECSAGDRLVMTGVEHVDPSTVGIRGTVQANTCGAPWTPKTWILIPYDGS